MHELLDLESFHKNIPEKEWNTIEDKTIYLQPGVKFNISVETAFVPEGLGRSNELAEKLHIYDADYDSHTFAKNLYDTIGNVLSIHDLEILIKVFSREVEMLEARRKTASKIKN